MNGDKAPEDNENNESCSSNLTRSTILYSATRVSPLHGDESLDEEQNKHRTGNKEEFFSSDSERTTVMFSSEESSSEKKKRKKAEDIVKKENRESKEKASGEKSLEQLDTKDKELQKLLRMTEINPQTHANNSGLEYQKEQKEKKNLKSKEEEISLLDCLEAENGEGDSAPHVDEKENYESDFISLVNRQLKKGFLLTSEESCESSDEEDNKRKKKKRKRKKKKKTKMEAEMKKPKKEKDDLSEFRIDGLSSEEGSAQASPYDVIEDSDESVKYVERVTKRKRESRNSQSATDADSESDIQQIYSKTESSPVKGRKNIKKILKKESLQVETKEALKNEEERKKRVKERQKLFEELFPDEKQIILDFDPETKEPLVKVHKKLVKKLKPHQVKGVRFMWDNCFESVKRLEEDSGSGCILAHCMGLGKTLQVITLVHTVMTHDLGVHTVLIVCPLSTVSNWIREFEMWQRQCVKKIKPIDLTPCKSKGLRFTKVKTWSREGGVLVISYGILRSLIKEEKMREFLDPDLIVCDEGHVLKNSNSALSKCMWGMKTLRRIILTGTPLQNNLMEYYCMVQFVKPNILGTVKEFKNRFFHPINNGQFEDSTQLDVQLMKRRAHVLHRMLDGFIQRFGYSVLTPFLPEKQEYVISIALTKTQENIYRFFIGQCNLENKELLKDFHWMQKAWTHPWVLLSHANKRGSYDATKEQWEKYVEEQDYTKVQSSGKLYLLFSILRKCKEIGDKVLVFSQSLLSLDLIEFFLKKANEKNFNNAQVEFADSWVFGEDYFRLDGSTSSENRNIFFQKFNDVNDKRFRLFLVSTKAGGLGVSLVAANRVVVFDASWNPSHDVQSIFRVYRFGQKKPCFIYRFLAAATMEEKIYKRQVTKLSLAHRILDEHQIERHYTMGNLQELYTYDPIPKTQWKVPKIPKDSLFAEILLKNLDTIVGYHEHDSLLENKEEEELTEEERKAAWEDYEKEKQKPEHPFAFNGVAMPELFNSESLKMTGRYQQGVATPVVSQKVTESEKPLCKIVDVRTLNKEEETRSERLFEIGRSFGTKPLLEETLQRYRERVNKNADGFNGRYNNIYG